jgi:nitrogen fixation-related uncharacterized protein
MRYDEEDDYDAPKARRQRDYEGRLEKLSEKFSGDTPEDRYRRIAREEAEKVVGGLAVSLGWMGAIIAASYWWKGVGVTLVLVAAVSWFFWTVFRKQYDPREDRHLVIGQAEDLCRLAIIEAAYRSGTVVWEVHKKAYDRDTRRIELSETLGWDNFTEKSYEIALELEKLSPHKRLRRLNTAAQDAQDVLSQGVQMAKDSQAELTYWAKSQVARLGRV